MYFAALLARTEDGWEASDTELDEVETLADLADLAREAAEDDEPVLVCIEQEGVWFGVVRVEGEEDPRIFVSDAAAAARSSYGEILLTDELLGREPGGEEDLDLLVDLDGTEDGEPPSDTEDDEDEGGASAQAAGAAPAGPVGDVGLLADFGMDGTALLSLTSEDALTEIADALGCTDMLEAVR
ncbi:tRNA adenosine deaminase-associated protein [Streptomyces mangrovi]|uniref:tRNA adenosine deaminase-associated protein n=1 Tax=Streptomyces mangrovi TaxID=1206892 RepID=UPI00399C9541